MDSSDEAEETDKDDGSSEDIDNIRFVEEEKPNPKIALSEQCRKFVGNPVSPKPRPKPSQSPSSSSKDLMLKVKPVQNVRDPSCQAKCTTGDTLTYTYINPACLHATTYGTEQLHTRSTLEHALE